MAGRYTASLCELVVGKSPKILRIIIASFRECVERITPVSKLIENGIVKPSKSNQPPHLEKHHRPRRSNTARILAAALTFCAAPLSSAKPIR